MLTFLFQKKQKKVHVITYCVPVTKVFMVSLADNYETQDAKKFFQENYSHIYYIFYDNFGSVEADLKQRGENVNSFAPFCLFCFLTVTFRSVPGTIGLSQYFQG